MTAAVWSCWVISAVSQQLIHHGGEMGTQTHTPPTGWFMSHIRFDPERKLFNSYVHLCPSAFAELQLEVFLFRKGSFLTQ